MTGGYESVVSHQNRRQSLRDSYEDQSVDAFLVTDETNVRYLTGFTGDSSYLVVTSDKAIILSDGRFESQIAEQCGSLDALIRPPGQLLQDLTLATLNDLNPHRVGIEANHLSVASFRHLDKSCPSIKFVDTSGVIESIRMIKDAAEISTTRAAVRCAEGALRATLESLTAAQTEREIAHRLEAEMRVRGANGCSFPTIVAAGPTGALPHYQPANSELGPSATLLIDWGADYEGYASDLTRTFHMPGASDRFRRAYESVLEAQLSAIEAIGPGVEAREVDEIARSVLDRAGLGAAFKHSLGHGIGLDIHEGPRISVNSSDRLAAGMIVTVEPGVYFEGDFGIRIEDDVLVTETGCEVLSQFPKGLDDCRIMK